jgi:signal transduction histidine kinase
MDYLLCPDAKPTLFQIFDLSIAPPLLFYSYIPIFLLTIFFGFFVWWKSNKSYSGKYFFALSLAFNAWIALILIQWTAAYAEIVHFAWQLLVIPETLIFLFSIFFTYTFLYKQRVPNSIKLIVASFYTSILLLVPTTFNMSSFDLKNCQSNVGILWNFVYIVELICLAIIAVIGYEKYKHPKDRDEKHQAIFLTIGMITFLGIFWLSNLFGELSKAYEINLVGPIGMVLFLGIMSYVIMRFKAFNIKIFSSQILVLGLFILVFAVLFIDNIDYVHTIIAGTLIMILVLGIQLIKGVQKEIQQREHIEILATDLEKANIRLNELDKLKSEFLSFASHQIRSPLTAIDGYASMLLEGDFGEMSEKVKNSIKVIDTSSKSLIKIVNEFLDISRIEQGRMKYDLTDFDAKKLAEEVVAELRPNVEKKGLAFEFAAAQHDDYMVHADQGKVKQVIGNIVDNAIKYTPTGKISIYLDKTLEKIHISIKDTGIGIDKDIIPRLFSKFTRDKDAYKTNVTGTGLGLYVAKQMIEAQKGRVWVESEGRGKGSTFYIELPIKAS